MPRDYQAYLTRSSGRPVRRKDKAGLLTALP